MAGKNGAKKKSLTGRQKRFADEYLIDLNATQAAIRAGYSEKTAYSMGQRLLKNVELQEYIKKRMTSLEYRTGITQERVLNEIAAVAFVKLTDYVQIVEKQMYVEHEGAVRPAYRADGTPIMERVVVPTLTEDLTESQKAALAVIKEGKNGIEVKAHDKMKALQQLGEYLSLFTDKERLALERERLNIEKQRLDIEKHKSETAGTDKDISIVIKGYEESWCD